MPTKLGRKRIRMDHNLFKITKTLTKSMVSQWNSSGIFSQDSIRCSSATKSKVLLYRLGETPEKLHRKNFINVDVSTTSLVEQKTMKKNVWQMLDSYLCTQGRFGK